MSDHVVPLLNVNHQLFLVLNSFQRSTAVKLTFAPDRAFGPQKVSYIDVFSSGDIYVHDGRSGHSFCTVSIDPSYSSNAFEVKVLIVNVLYCDCVARAGGSGWSLIV